MTMISSPRFHRAAIVAQARRWTGTPYHHQASCISAGVDCIGLVRGVWRALYGSEPETLPGYGRDWSEATGRETLLDAARRHFSGVHPNEAGSGDVLVFRYRPQAVAKHVGILAISSLEPGASAERSKNTIRLGDPLASASLIHAVEGAPVTEIALTGWWRRRLVAAFRFPKVID
jgi:NlpC/P60 family putative phage cell wall peptidase